jgi:carbon-monoxide dehydrogenase medium subunit
MKEGIEVTDVVHLGRVPDLTTITSNDDVLSIGACVTHRALGAATVIRQRAPELAAAWQLLGNIRVRIKGTIGGNLMAHEPEYDGAPLAMALGATLVFCAPNGCQRRMPAAALPEVQPAAGLLLAVEFPTGARVRLATERSLRPVVNLAVGMDWSGDHIVGLRVAIGCAYQTPCVWPLAVPESLTDAALLHSAAALAEAFAAGLPEPIDDWRASSHYRRRMIGVLLRRTLERVGKAA